MRLPQPLQRIERRILLVRGRKVLLSADLADVDGVESRTLVQAVKRNLERLPGDSLFRLSWREVADLRPLLAGSDEASGPRSRSQFVILKRGRNLKYPPYAFTEEGVAMLSGVLRSRRAVRVNVAIMRAFVRLREIFSAHRDLARRLDEIERKTDSRFRTVFDAIRGLVAPPILRGAGSGSGGASPPEAGGGVPDGGRSDACFVVGGEAALKTRIEPGGSARRSAGVLTEAGRNRIGLRREARCPLRDASARRRISPVSSQGMGSGHSPLPEEPDSYSESLLTRWSRHRAGPLHGEAEVGSRIRPSGVIGGPGSS